MINIKHILIFFLFLMKVTPIQAHQLHPMCVVGQLTKTPIWVEHAISEEQQKEGLMWRIFLPPYQGMLFFHAPKDKKHVAFWMKHTFIPLDILFLDDQGVILDIKKNVTPLSESLIIPEKPPAYTLELNAGFVEKQQLMLGDKVIHGSCE